MLLWADSCVSSLHTHSDQNLETWSIKTWEILKDMIIFFLRVVQRWRLSSPETNTNNSHVRNWDYPLIESLRIWPWRCLTMVWWRIWRKRLRPSCELSGVKRLEPPRLCPCPPRALRKPLMKLRSGHYLRRISKPVSFLAWEKTSPSLSENENVSTSWFVSITV